MTDLEPGRPLPNFTVTIYDDGDDGGMTDGADLARALQDVYDIAINSMDMGSGFLSTEEVGNLRMLGAAIGAEPFDYQHDKCLRCRHTYGQHGYADPRICRVRPYPYGQPECICEGYVRPA